MFNQTVVDFQPLLLMRRERTRKLLVAGTWDFERINRRSARHLKVLDARPGDALCNLKSALAITASHGIFEWDDLG